MNAQHRWRLVRFPLLILVFCAAVLLFVFFVYAHYSRSFVSSEVSRSPGVNMSESEWKKFWSDRITAVGGTRAYEEMAEDIASITPASQHTIAHTFGDALYDKMGYD